MNKIHAVIGKQQLNLKISNSVKTTITATIQLLTALIAFTQREAQKKKSQKEKVKISAFPYQ